MPMKIEFTHDDVVSVKTALTKMGVSVPETDDLADNQILGMFRHLAECVREGDYMMHRTYTQAEYDAAVKAAKITGMRIALDLFDVVDNNCMKEDDWEKVIDLWKDAVGYEIKELENG